MDLTSLQHPFAGTISVVVPTYNRAALLPATLDAILAQTLPPQEIIVVDDGSEDRTGEVLARYSPRVTSLRIPNSGDLAARNVGLRAARGDLVAFCDSDDLWRPNFLARMATFWQVEPRTKVAYSDFVIVRDDEWQSATKFADAPPGFWNEARSLGPDLAAFDHPVVERLIHFQPFFASCIVADRRSFLDVGGWDESVGRTPGSDFATALRFAEQVPLGVLHSPLVGIRKHAGNYSADVQAMNLGDARVLERVIGTRPSLAAYMPQIRASVVLRRQQALDTAFARGDFASVREIYALLPTSQRPRALRVKLCVASLPGPLRKPALTLLLSLGSLRSRLNGQHFRVMPAGGA